MMFETLRLSAEDGARSFRELGFRFWRRNEKPQALLCLDQFFIHYDFYSLPAPPSSDTVSALEDFHDYCRLFRDTVLSLDLANEDYQMLFNFRPASIQNAYNIRLDTWLHQQATITEISIMDRDEEGIVVSASDLLDTLQKALWQRLAECLCYVNEACLEIWTPCLSFAMNRDSCWLGRRCSAGQHLSRQSMSQAWFNGQLRGILLQIVLYQIYHAIPIAKTRTDIDPRR